MKEEPRITRREVMTRGGAALVASTALASVSTSRAAAGHADTKPPHVTIEGDTAWLKQYRPMLDLRDVPSDNRPSLYGWKVASPDHDLDVGVFACEYAVQDDVFSLTSHAGDHEWVYVFVDNGKVHHVSYSAYHWLKGSVSDPNVYDDSDGPHPTFKVADTYHHYYPTPKSTESSVLLTPYSLGDNDSESGPFYHWLENGMEKDLHRGAVHDPWRMAIDGPLTDWWSDEGITRFKMFTARAFLKIGIRGADVADGGDVSL